MANQSFLQNLISKVGEKTPKDIGEDMLKSLLFAATGGASAAPKIASKVAPAIEGAANIANTPLAQLLQGNIAQAAPIAQPQVTQPQGGGTQTAQSTSPSTPAPQEQPLTLAEQEPNLVADRKQFETLKNKARKEQLQGAIDTQGFDETEEILNQREQAFNQQFIDRPQGLLEQLFQSRGLNEEGQFQSGGVIANFRERGRAAFGGESPLDQLLKAQKLTGTEAIQPKDLVTLAQNQLTEAKKAQQAGKLKPGELFTKFETASEAFVQVRDGFSRMQFAMTNPETNDLDFSGVNPAGDLDLLFGTAKTLDPGGRVTDSDVAIQNLVAGKYGDKLKKIAQKFQRKGTLAPGERRALLQAGKRRFQSAEAHHANVTVPGFIKLGKASGIDESVFIRDVGLTQPGDQGGSQAANFQQTSSGNQFRLVQ